ncbi:unnamed protein product, partial [Rotaria magnacalcarata]
MSQFHRQKNYSSTSNRQQTLSSNNKSQSNETRNYQHHHRYTSPLEKLDKLNNRYVKKKVEQNNKYKALYENGECSKFELSSSLFTQFYIN